MRKCRIGSGRSRNFHRGILQWRADGPLAVHVGALIRTLRVASPNR